MIHTRGPKGKKLKFFGQDGNAMEMTINGMPWDRQPLSISPLSSERLVLLTGTLLVGSNVPIAVTILQTKRGVVFSTLPVRALIR